MANFAGMVARFGVWIWVLGGCGEAVDQDVPLCPLTLRGATATVRPLSDGFAQTLTTRRWSDSLFSRPARAARRLPASLRSFARRTARGCDTHIPQGWYVRAS